MAFDPLTSTEVSAGEPTKQEIFSKVRTNEIDLDSRVSTTEAALNAFLPIRFGANGVYGIFTTLDKVGGHERLTFNLTVTAVRLVTRIAGSSGSTEVDILFKRGAGAYTSILTTRASVTSASGNDAISTNAVLDGTNKLLQAGDLLVCDLTAVQGGVPRSFAVFVEFDKT